MEYDHDHENEVIPFAETNFRNEKRRFGVKTDDRRRHMYILGKTGMGKTTLMENMMLADINAGHGVGLVDPHGDYAEKLIDFIPSHRINDVIYFNPADMDYPIGFNVLEAVDERHKHLVASGLMGVFKKIWPDVWSARMEYILNNCILALLDYPGSTLLGINRLLVDREFRKRVVSQIKDPVVRVFWVDEYSSWEDRFRNEAIAPIQNKVGQFLSASIIRNIVAQVKSTIDIRQVMDEGKIFIMNLAKGRIGEDNSRLLGGMLITKLQLAAMERVDIPELERRDFYLYVDEFQNFATQAFANILSEARKYRLNLIFGHQYIEQLDEDYVRPAVFGNVGTIICFRVGAQDAEFLENEFTPRFTIEDLANLTKFEIYLKLMINGVASAPFSARTLPPISQRTGNADKVIRVTRERYSEPRDIIEEKINRWSGLSGGEEGIAEMIKRMDEVPEKSSKKKKVMYDYVCTRCKKDIQLPVKLDPSRPIYCEECLPIIRGEKPAGVADGAEGYPAPIKVMPREEKIILPKSEATEEIKETKEEISLTALAKKESVPSAPRLVPPKIQPVIQKTEPRKFLRQEPRGEFKKIQNLPRRAERPQEPRVEPPLLSPQGPRNQPAPPLRPPSNPQTKGSLSPGERVDFE